MEQTYQPHNDVKPILTEIVGQRITLRPLEVSDLTPGYLAWFRDEEFTRFLEASNISRSDAEAHLTEGLQSNLWAMLAIVVSDSNRHIGNVKVGPINWKHGVSGMPTVIGDRQSWGQGLATEAIRLAGDAAFSLLGLRKLSDGVVEGNDGSVRAYCNAGWEVEGRLRGHVLVNGVPKDRILISRFNPNYFS